MSALAQGLSAAAFTALFGGSLDALSVRMGWTRRRNWVALAIVPLLVGVMRYISAAG